jgi:hypothetical protein
MVWAATCKESKGSISTRSGPVCKGDFGGSKIGGLGLLVTLGSGTSSKVIQRGVTWAACGIGGGGWRKQAGRGGGLQEGTGVAATVGKRGVATLGCSMATLGHPGDKTKRGLVEIKRALEVFPRGDPGVESKLSK